MNKKRLEHTKTGLFIGLIKLKNVRQNKTLSQTVKIDTANLSTKSHQIEFD